MLLVSYKKSNNLTKLLKNTKLGPKGIILYFRWNGTIFTFTMFPQVIGISQSGKELTDEEFLEQQPQMSCTWAVEVNSSTLPCLPDCPVTNVIQVLLLLLLLLLSLYTLTINKIQGGPKKTSKFQTTAISKVFKKIWSKIESTVCEISLISICYTNIIQI